MAGRYFILIMILSLMGPMAYAQVRDTDIVLSLSPQYPSSNQNVTATLSSYTTDLNKALIVWSINNQEASEGVGKKSFYFTTESSDTLITLTASINTVNWVIGFTVVVLVITMIVLAINYYK